MSVRRVAFLAAAVVAVAMMAAPARATHAEGVEGTTVTPAEGVDELHVSRDLVAEAVDLYEQGKADAAYEAALSAYLDHFEYVEIPLRIRDERLTLEVEEDFATLRALIESGAPADDVQAVATEVRRGLDRVERTLSEPGMAAPLIAGTYSFIILFREGLEAVLVIAAVLGYLEASRNTQYKPAVLRGVALAGVATVATFVLAAFVLEIAPVQRELLEAGTALLAVGVLFYVSFWLVSRLEHRRWMEFVKAKVWAAATTGSTLALAGVGFTAVYREGFETVLFYQALLTFAEGLGIWVAAGAAVGLLVLGAIGYSIFRAGRKLPIKPFLTTAVVMIMVLSVTFVGNAVRALQEAAVISLTFIRSLPALPIFLADLTGWHPTRETLLAQAALAAIYVAGAVWTFVILPRRGRTPAEPQTVDAPAPAPERTPVHPG